jgi:hypothetical protein
MKYLVFDISNLLYRTFFVQRQEDDETLAGLATHTALVMLNKYYKQHRPDKVVMVFDRKSWRKDYTASDACISKKPYKGNRRQDMTPAQQLKYQRFLTHMREFEALIAEQTTIVTLVEDMLEADDLIAGFCQIEASDDNEIVIISTDSDLLQLMQYTNVRIVSPATDKEQTLSEFDGDPLFYVFQKCIRGDSTDNVQSAYPRVRMDRIKKAFTDPYERVQLMNETWTAPGPVVTDENGEEVVSKITYKVADLFDENEKLINLAKQPPNIRKLILESVSESLDKKRQFSMFFILKFLGKYKLVKIKESLDQYIPMLSK